MNSVSGHWLLLNQSIKNSVQFPFLKAFSNEPSHLGTQLLSSVYRWQRHEQGIYEACKVHVRLGLLKTQHDNWKRHFPKISFIPCVYHCSAYSKVKKYSTSFHLTSMDGSSSPTKGHVTPQLTPLSSFSSDCCPDCTGLLL